MRIILVVLALLLCQAAYAAPSHDDLRRLGVGMWTWQLAKCGSPEEIARKAVSNGVARVYLKVHDGAKPYGEQRRIVATAKACQAAGVKVFVWGFNHANRPQEEAALIQGWLSRDYVDGYVYNTEAPLKSQGKWNAVEELCAKVWQFRERQHPRKFLGFAPYAFPSRHSALPYGVLVRYSDFIEPQMYHATMRRTVKDVVNTTYREWLKWQRNNGLNKPIVPLGQTYGGVAHGSVTEFGRRTKGYYAVSFWSWQHTPEALWGEIRQVSSNRAEGYFPEDLEKPAVYVAKPVQTPKQSNPSLWERVGSVWSGWLANYWKVAAVLLFAALVLVPQVNREYPIEYNVGWYYALLVPIVAWPYVLAVIVGVFAIIVGLVLVVMAGAALEWIAKKSFQLIAGAGRE